MKYDKKSFCAGIAVGVQLKGWASLNSGGTGASDVVSHIYPKVARLRIPPILPVLDFEHPAVRAITMNVPKIIPVHTYEGGE